MREEANILELLWGLLGGTGLFLFGVHTMGDGLERAAGKRLRRILEFLTSSPLKGVAIGAAITVLIQSSSAATVMVVSFVDAGLITLKQATGVIFGANIGTTITTQLVALNLNALALPAVGIGFLLFFLSRQPRIKTLGEVILGFGLVFLGMNIMSSSVEPLRDDPFFYNIMATMSTYPLIGVLIGTLLTAIIQASSATIGMTIALGRQGIIGLPAAMGLVLGSKIGTTATALLASVGTSLNARRAALTHFLFNAIGVIIVLPFLRPFITVIQATGRDMPHQIANAHTFFSILNTVVFFPFTKQLGNLVRLMLPGEDVELERGLKYIDNRNVSRVPANIALGQVTQELVRMGELAMTSLQDAMSGIYHSDGKLVKLVTQKEEIIDSLEMEITTFLATISQQGLDRSASRRLTGLLHIVNDLERVGDHAYELVRMIDARLDKNAHFSEEAQTELKELYDLAIKSLEASLEALGSDNLNLARQVVEWEKQADILERSYRDKHIVRVNEGVCMVEAGVVFLDIIGSLGRVIDHANNVAQIVLDDF